MKRFAWMCALAAALAVGVAGCNWDTGSDAESWSSSYDWVNFSGVYRGAGGGYLVTDYTTTAPETNKVLSATESFGVLPAYGTSKSGSVDTDNLPIVEGSFRVQIGTTATLTDSGNGVLSGDGSGVVSYSGGGWAVSNVPPDVTADRKVTVEYSYRVSPGGGQSGASGTSIYAFNVKHSGENLSIVDNNGSTYSGYISQIKSSSGAQNTDIGQVGADESANDSSRAAKYTYSESDLPADGDSIIASFECSGVSKAGMQVKIVGTLQGEVAAGVFTGRRMNGTWVEAGGKTGDIYGTTSSMPIPTSSTATGTPEEIPEETPEE